MKILGINNGSSSHGKQLHDGSVCYVENGVIKCIVIEERITQNKRDGGFNSSLLELFENYNLCWSDIDLVVNSSCCDKYPLFPLSFCENTLKTKVVSVNHHLSHALSVYYLSPFDKSIIVVSDAGGNTIDDENRDWWTVSREQNSYFLANGSDLELIGRDFEGPTEAGIGEIYRAFAYFLGWKSSIHAGKVMALSSYGHSGVFVNSPLFNISNDCSITSIIVNNPSDPIGMVEQALDNYGIDFVKKREPDGQILQAHIDLAKWVQDEVQRVFVCKIKHLMKVYRIRNFCMAGGVAYNCKLNGYLERHIDNLNLFVGPASGDQGQSLGNAFSYLPNIGNKYRFLSPYCGIDRFESFKRIEPLVHDLSDFKVCKLENIEKVAARLISEGEILCWFQNRSEFGARALGNRSILADPRNPRSRYLLNKIKGRDTFMPFAPSVLSDKMHDFFECYGYYGYMTHALEVLNHKRKYIPAVVHVDGTARAHAVGPDDNQMYFDLIKEFFHLTDIPMILNTSFNGKGKPIVETIDDALKFLTNIDINKLVIGNYLIEKTKFEQKCHDTGYEYSLDRFNLDEVRDDIIKKTNTNVKIRHKFNLYSGFVDWVKSGRKYTTIRYVNGFIDFPSDVVCEMFSTKSYHNFETVSYVCDLELTNIKIKKFDELNINDALNDGFETLQELKSVLNEIYGAISPSEYLTIYSYYPIFRNLLIS